MKTPSEIFAEECQARHSDMMQNCANDESYQRRMGEAMRAVPEEELRRRNEAMAPMFANAYWPAIRDQAQEQRINEACARQAEMRNRAYLLSKLPWWRRMLWRLFGD